LAIVELICIDMPARRSALKPAIEQALANP
jgi:hypothetical protein